MKRTAALSAAGATALLLSSLAPVSAVEPSVRIVDDSLGMSDQCPGAAFATIQAGVDAAQPGDIVQVCPGTYRERVVVEKTLTLQGFTKTENIDCFTADLSALDPTQVSILEPLEPSAKQAGNLLTLAADNIKVSGFVLQKQKQTAPAPYEAALETDSSHFGYDIRENIFYGNDLGVEFGSAGITYDSEGQPIGGSTSTFKENCLHNNRWALANQRLGLRDALIAENQSTNNTEKAYELGTLSAGVQRVTVADNESQDDKVMVALTRNVSTATITGNIVENTEAGTSLLRSIEVRHQVTKLKITDNLLNGAGVTSQGIAFLAQFSGTTAAPVSQALVTGNDIKGYLGGIIFGENANATENSVEENSTHDNSQIGIAVFGGSNSNTFTLNKASANGTAGIRVRSGASGNIFTNNTADENGTAGIQVLLGASGNTFNGNSMHRNGSAGLAGMADAVDLSGNPVLNTWTGNSCTTSIPDGLLCALP